VEGNDCDLIRTSLQDFEETNKGTVNGGEDGWSSVWTIVSKVDICYIKSRNKETSYLEQNKER
jgi:hypothetical protein